MKKGVIAVAIGLLGWTEPSLAAPSVDGAELPEIIDVTYSAQCKGARSSLGYRQQRKHPGSLSTLELAISVSLTQFVFSDRKVSDADMGMIGSLVRDYAWIENVRYTCDTEIFFVQVQGMKLKPWIDYVQRRLQKRPDLVTNTIRVDGSGRISLVNGMR